MAGTVVAVFKSKEAAHISARKLVDSGVPLNDISVVVKESHVEDASVHDPEGAVLVGSVREVDHHDVEQPHSGSSGSVGRVATGVTVGVSLGALVGSALIVVPGIGPLIAAGPIAALIGSAVAGGVMGGVAGALASDGIPERAATLYHDHVNKGDALVTVLTSAHRAQSIEAVLENGGGREIGFFPRVLDSVQSLES
jgi:hypothetical protein